MSNCGVHCPFLNRADSRCSHHFSLDRLEHAFEHCFGQYQSCPTYLELLVERQTRRSMDMLLAGSEHEEPPIVQLRIRPTDRYQKSAA